MEENHFFHSYPLTETINNSVCPLDYGVKCFAFKLERNTIFLNTDKNF